MALAFIFARPAPVHAGKGKHASEKTRKRVLKEISERAAHHQVSFK